MRQKGNFDTNNFKDLSTVGGGGGTPHTLPPLGRSAPSLWSPLTNPVYTTVTGITMGVQGPMPPPQPH